MSEEKRAFVHGLWASVADQWVERADYLEARSVIVTKMLVERVEAAPTDHALALADGTGGMSLALASEVAAVVSSDVVPAMVEAAARRAQERGITNLTAQLLDVEQIDAADAAFDIVVSREGLMFAVEPQQALRGIARVLRPGGRLAAAVWSAPERNPWLAAVMTAVSEIVGHEVPPPGMPGPFALADVSRLAALVDGADLVDFACDTVEVPFHAPSFDAWWDHTSALAGPVANIIKGFDDAQSARVSKRLHELIAPYESGEGLEIPGEALVFSARKPAT